MRFADVGLDGLEAELLAVWARGQERTPEALLTRWFYHAADEKLDEVEALAPREREVFTQLLREGWAGTLDELMGAAREFA